MENEASREDDPTESKTQQKSDICGVDEEVESEKRSWMSKGKGCKKQLREIEKFTDMDPLFLEGQKERW